MTDTTDLLRSHFRKAENEKAVEDAWRNREMFLREKAIRTMAEPGFLAPDWAKYSNSHFPRPLMVLFALSVGINPDLACFEVDGHLDAFSDAASTTENVSVAARIHDFTSRWELFELSEGHPDTPKPWPERDYPHRPLLRPLDFAAWAVSVGWELPEGFPSTVSSGATSSTTQKPLPRSAVQDAGILDAIKARDIDPKSLPKPKRGKPSLKAEIKKELGTTGVWAGTTVFNKAWERLAKNGDIAYES